MRVPQEVADVIIQNAKDDPITLCNLCLVSTTFLPKARQVLYHEIRITRRAHSGYPGWSIGFQQATKLFQTIIVYNRSLGKYIQKLYQWRDPSKSEYEKLMRQALRLMDNLESLIGDISGSVLSEDHPFQLKCFEFCAKFWDSHGEETQFFVSQSSLKTLYANGDPELLGSIPKAFFPKLEALAGNRCTIETVLPDRPLITKLAWVPSGEDDVSTLPHILAPGLSKIRALCLGGGLPRPDLRLFLPYLQSLQVLRIYGETPHLALRDEFALISEFPKLRVFIWSDRPSTSSGVFLAQNKMGRHAQNDWVKALFSKTTILEKVYLQISNSDTEFLHPLRPRLRLLHLLCWERDKVEEPRLVDSWDIAAAHDDVSWEYLEQ